MTEKREMRKGIELVFSKRDEKADEVIKRMAMAKGAGVIVITSDREIARYAERLSVSVIPSDRFLERLEEADFRPSKVSLPDEKERGQKTKGPSRKLSKKERRRLAALKKL